MNTVVLVHAPLVGPSTWRWVADELRSQGHTVFVPLLRDDAALRGAELQSSLIERAAAAVPRNSEAVLVGHSGAGMLLPLVAERSSARSVRFVFVDSGVPPAEGNLDLAGDEFRASLQERVESDGRLPGWDTWWGEGAMEWMVPDAARRAAIVSDIPRLALSYFDPRPALPGGWRSAPCGYVLLSEVYRSAADDARAEGWPVVEVLGTHLELVNQPTDVAKAIIDVSGVVAPQ